MVVHNILWYMIVCTTSFLSFNPGKRGVNKKEEKIEQ